MRRFCDFSVVYNIIGYGYCLNSTMIAMFRCYIKTEVVHHNSVPDAEKVVGS